MMKKLNSAEIARLAGVSRSTVSRVVNGYSNVPDDTRERVMKIINESGYYPLFSGQLLMGKKTGTLGFFWVANGTIANDIQCSAFFVHVTETAAELGYLVLTCIVKNLKDEENVNWIKRIFMQGRVDAGIFIGVNNNEPLIEELLSRGKIVGIFDHFQPERQNPNRISVNFEVDTGEKVIDYVCGLGHRKIAVIDGNMNRFSCVKRHEGYIRGLQAHNIEIRHEWMYYGDETENGGYRAAKELLAGCREYPTVICANNDSAAFGVYKALEEANIRVPDQISVIGIDGHEGGKMVSPSLTSYEFDFEKIFFSLVSRTIAVVEQKENVPDTEFFPSRLVERNSCRAIEIS
jgi:LacI family transcriptional regulator